MPEISNTWIGVHATVTAPKVPIKLVVGFGLLSLLGGTSPGYVNIDEQAAYLPTGSSIYGPVAAAMIEPSIDAMSSAEQIMDVHASSGLTWEQISKLFGVSRRSVHLWANGGKLSASNHETLVELHARVHYLNVNSPEEARSALLRVPSPGVPSIFDELRGRNAGLDSDVNRASIGVRVDA